MSDLFSLQREDVLLVRFKAPCINSDAMIARIGQELIRLADQANGKLLLDFSGVSFVSSAMIGKLVLLKKSRIKTDVRLSCISPSEQAREALVGVVNLDKVFRIYETEAEALAAFQKKS